MSVEHPKPEQLDDYLLENMVDTEAGDTLAVDRRASVKAENAIASKYWGGVQWRMILTFLIFSCAWVAVLTLGLNGSIPLWLGLVSNTVIATTFYMPMHEATHKNIWGRSMRARKIEDLIGMLCSVPLGFSFTAHRASHMKHHAFTNDPDRDPDHFTHGTLGELPLKCLSAIFVNAFLPVIALVPASRKLVHPAIRRSLGAGGSRSEGLAQLRFWLISHGILLVAFLIGLGWPALLCWYLPSRLQAAWLLFIFAWFPHHPADQVGRYVDTRVAVFSGSTFIIRGHDHHALHHLYPRVPHYRLKAMWQEMADDLVTKGVRVEGRARAATAPVAW
jgi:beta-carotene hydroxylase